jgi:hypothetical protein
MDNTLKQDMNDAGTLARFANLEESEIGQFRTANPQFLPKWWDDSGNAREQNKGLIWKYWQDLLRKWWLRLQEGPSSKYSNFVLALVTYCADTESSWDALGFVDTPFDTDVELVKALPYQRAVMFMALNPWRARICRCGNRFIADKPNRQFCSDVCAWKFRKKKKREWIAAQRDRTRRKKRTRGVR